MARSNYRGGTTTRRAPKELNRRVKKKPCALCRDKISWVDYKDVPLLRKYMSDRGKIRSRRVTGNCAQHQRALAVAIKTARELVLLPYTQRTVTEKPGGRGGRGERGDRTLASTAGRGMAPGGERIEGSDLTAAPQDVTTDDEARVDDQPVDAESPEVPEAEEVGATADVPAEDEGVPAAVAPAPEGGAT
jgi:small subunit ribosomal protein S18